MWSDEGFFLVQGTSMLDLLFDKSICSEIVNAFLSILQSPRYRSLHNIKDEFGYLSVFAMVSGFITYYGNFYIGCCVE